MSLRSLMLSRWSLAAFLASCPTISYAAPVAIDLPEQSLDASLRQLIDTTGISVDADKALVEGKSAPAVHGTMEPADAVTRLLKGSGLTATVKENGAIRIAMAKDKTLGEVTVESDIVPRPDVEPDSLVNPYRVPTTNRDGVEIFNAEAIQNLKPKDVFDLLDMATGITVTYQGRKNPYFVKERGGGSFTYIIDGAILPTVTQRILSRIPLDAIESLEVVRDSTALTLGPLINIGSSSSGGGINTGYIIIRTRQPKKTFEASAVGAVEKSPNQQFAHRESLFAGTHYTIPDTKLPDLLGEPTKDNLNGYLAVFGSNFDRPSQQKMFDGQSGSSDMAKVGLGNDRVSLSFEAFQESGRFEMQRGVNVNTGALDNSKWYYDPATTSVQVGSGTVNWIDGQSTLFSVFHTEYNQLETDAYFNTASMTSSQSKENTSGFSVVHNGRFWEHTYLSLGAQGSHSIGVGPSGPGYTDWDTSIMGYSATVEQRLFDDTVFLDAGFRRDQKDIDHDYSYPTTVGPGSYKTLNNNNTSTPPAEAYSFGARWQITPVYALNGRYFVANQGAFDSGYNVVLKNDAPLDAEEQQRIELTGEAHLLPEFNLSSTWFQVHTDNDLAPVSSTYVVNGVTYNYYEQQNTRRSGVELAVNGKFLGNSSYRASWTHLYTIFTSSADAASTTAKNLYNISVSHRWGDWVANASMKAVGPYTSSNVHVGDYSRFDANIARSFQLGPLDWTGTLYGRNLGNSHYVTMTKGTNAYPDRGVTVGLEFKVEY